MIGVLGILIYVIVQMVPGLDIGVWHWILLGIGLMAAAGALIGSGGGLGSPHFRKIRFFNTTDSKVSSLKIKRVPPQPPPVQLPPTTAGQATFKDASYDEPFFTNVIELAVEISVEDPANPMGPPRVGNFNIQVPMGAGLIEELVIILGGTNGAYSGAAWAMYGVDDSLPLQATAPVNILIA